MKALKYLFILLPIWGFGQSADGTYKTVTANGTNNYTISEVLKSPDAYDSKEKWIVTFTNANTGAVTINRNSLGAKSLKKLDGSDFISGEIPSGGRLSISYNGTYYQVIGGAGGSNVTIGSFNNTSTANGLDFTSNILTLHAADITNPGAVSTAAQSFSGAKTFTSDLNINANLHLSQNSSGISGSNADLNVHPSTNIRLTNASLVSLASISTSGITTGHQLWLHNDTGNPIVIINNGTPPGGSAKINTTFGANITLQDQNSIILEYDAIDSAWRLVGNADYLRNGGPLGTPSSGTLTNATGLPPTTGISGWPANSSGVLTNNGSGTLSWGSAGTTYSADESTLHLASTTFSLKSSFYNTTPTASNLAEWDANKNLSANSFIPGFNSSATAGGSTTLTVGSPRLQYRTGTANETITLPVTSTLSQGLSYIIDNTANTGTLTVNSSGGNTILTMAGGSSATLTCILTSGTTAASWGFVYNPQSPLTQVGDLLVGGTVVGGVATPSKVAAGTATYPLVSNGSGAAPSYQLLSADAVAATPSTTAATVGNIGEPLAGTAVTTYTNITTSATYKNIASVTLTPGDWVVRGSFTLYGNSATITTTADAIFVISTTTASATGAVEGKSFYYIAQNVFAASSTAHHSGEIVWHVPQSASSVTYYLNVQATFSAGNMQYVGHIEGIRPR